MQTFIGTKQVRAKPMTRKEYCDFRGWTVPADENPDDAGYLVEYLDGGKPNTADYAGYVSWSPKEQFDNAYRATSGLSFGLAVEALKQGKRIARALWNNANFLMYVPPISIEKHEGQVIYCSPICQAINGRLGYGSNDYTAKSADILADDWQIID